MVQIKIIVLLYAVSQTPTGRYYKKPQYIPRNIITSFPKFE